MDEFWAFWAFLTLSTICMVNVFATLVFLHYSKAEYKIIIEVLCFINAISKWLTWKKWFWSYMFQNNFLTTYNVKIINKNYVPIHNYITPQALPHKVLDLSPETSGIEVGVVMGRWLNGGGGWGGELWGRVGGRGDGKCKINYKWVTLWHVGKFWKQIFN